MPFRFFEQLVDPFPAKQPGRSPRSVYEFCRHYSRGYLAHLFQIGDPVAARLATIHNLRFYSLLMEKLRA